MAILAIDVGNSRAKLGIWNHPAHRSQSSVALTAIPLTEQTDLRTEVLQWLKTVDSRAVDRAVIAGSNPVPVRALLNRWLSKELAVTLIESYKQVPLKMDVEHPETVGIDRLLTAVAVRSRQTVARSVIVVDAGTATTVNLTTADGTFRGGAILPGMRMMTRALHDYTAVLPLIDADSLCGTETALHTTAGSQTTTRPNQDAMLNQDAILNQNAMLKMPGRHTTAAIQNGIFWGHLGSIKELIGQMLRCLPEFGADPAEVDLVVTGGGGRQLAALIPNATYEDSLALTGLATLAEKGA